MNAGQARHLNKLVPEDFLPERFHLGDLGKESMPADVEPEVLVPDGAGETPNLGVALERAHPVAPLGKQIARGEPGRACAADQNPIARR